MEKERKLPAPILLIAYSAAAFGYHAAIWFLFPPEKEPLAVFFLNWRILRAASDFVTTFPAAALAAIAASFGFVDWGSKTENRFSPRFMDFMRSPLFAIIASAALYAVLFLFVQPLAFDSVSAMRSKGILFRTAAEKAEAAVSRRAWKEASGYLSMCEQVWPNSAETEETEEKLSIGLSIAKAEEDTRRKAAEAERKTRKAQDAGNATTSTEALALARKAYGESRYFDAHWLATLAERLAREGTAENFAATRLAADSWNAVAELEPKPSEKAAFAVYRKKREGYAAVLAEDWIRAYYIYEELSRSVKDDPDVVKFFKLSEAGARGISFFSDEVGASVGAVDLDVLLSFPNQDKGRDILRIGRLHPFADAAYGENFELLSFDASGGLRSSVSSPFMKAVPFNVEKERTVLLLLALDREDESIRWAPVWQRGSMSVNAENRVVLELPYEDLLLAIRAKRGTTALSIPELFRSAKTLPAYGFVKETFRAEALRRFSEPFAFLSLAVFVLALSWRQRPLKRVGWTALPILVLLPIALNVAAQGYRILSAEAAAVFTLTLPYGAALAAVVVLHTSLLLFGLVFLAGQRS